VPTVAELGLPGFEALSWLGLLAPAGTLNNVTVEP
jgi:tripartite-type tricarboxylate transporter receptor subunit TctC